MKKIILLFFLVSMFGYSQSSSRQNMWTKVDANSSRIASKQKVRRSSQPSKFDVYKLDITSLKNELQHTPLRGDVTARNSNVVLEFPNAQGVMESFAIIETPIMEPELAAKFPMIKSYAGQGIQDPSATIRFSVTQFGLHTQTLSGTKGSWFIEPYTEDRENYVVYEKVNLEKLTNDDFRCSVDDTTVDASRGMHGDGNMTSRTNDSTLRTFRLAQSCTGEYAQFFAGGGTVAQQKANVQAQMAITMTRVNGIYERDLSTTMIFVGNNDQIIYLDGATDPWNGEWNTQTAVTIDAQIGVNNYDIGHNFNDTGGGNAGCLFCVCLSASQTGTHKGRGYTGSANPTGDPFDVDYVAHEMGHQFGGYHTMNSCSRSGGDGSEVEPASGSTIMGYAGICGSNVQNQSDAYFLGRNIDHIFDNFTGGGSYGNSTCAATTGNGNNPPTAAAGANITVPSSTPYILEGTSTDPDGTAGHTFTWEQIDDTQVAEAPPSPTATTGPTVRSMWGTTDGNRYIPNLSDLRFSNGGGTTWEALPSVNRSMNFELTVRDNEAGGGQTANDFKTITVTNTAGPFLVTSQGTTGVSWTEGATETVTWNVAGTNAGTINTPTVDIFLSTDGGLTYPTTLATGVPNNGSANVTVPNTPAPYCRVMVRGNGHIFFNINTADFAIGYTVTRVCNDYPFTINTAIPGNATAYETFNANVPDSNTITDINVTYDMTVPRRDMGDHYAGINSPAGDFVNFFAGDCANVNQDGYVCTFDDAAPAFTCIPTGTVKGNGNLNDFIGQDSAGTWRLRYADVGNNGMTFNSANLNICYDDVVPITACAAVDSTEEINPGTGYVAGTSLTICEGAAAGIQPTVPSGANPTYSWVGPNTFTQNTRTVDLSALTAADSGVYTVTVNMDGSCASTDYNFNVTINPTNPDLTTSVEGQLNGGGYVAGTSVTATDGDMVELRLPSSAFNGTWQWYNPAGTPMGTGETQIVGAAVVDADPTQEGTWQVTATFTNDCARMAPQTIDFDVIINPLLTTNFNEFDGLAIYPNPTSDLINISSSTNLNNTNLSLVDLRGRIVLNKLNDTLSNNISLDLSEIAQGSYFLIIENDTKKSVRQIIKK